MNIVYYLKRPNRIFRELGAREFFNFLDDEKYLKILYFFETGKLLNLDNPISYNEKIQWLKLYDRNENYPKLVDKFEVRKIVSRLIGNEYLIPLIADYDMPEQIKWDNLPEQFVIKCTHGSYTNIICTNKSELDYKLAENQLNKWMKMSWFPKFREWPYSQIKPRIIIEKYMEDESGSELKDYKIFCFDGKPEFIQVDIGRFSDHKRNIYNLDWNLMDVEIENPSDQSIVINKPQKLDEMLHIARVLSQGYRHVRIDLYSIEDKIYFGEFTLYHGGGVQRIKPESFNNYLGKLIKL